MKMDVTAILDVSRKSSKCVNLVLGTLKITTNNTLNEYFVQLNVFVHKNTTQLIQNIKGASLNVHLIFRRYERTLVDKSIRQLA
jgi:hypothetical protein